MSYTKVQDWGLYIGDKKTARDRDLLASMGISRIVNVTTEIRNYFEDEHDHFKYLKCPCVDSEVADLGQYFERACGFINDAREHGHNVLVHCQQGVSRSASIVIAYLIKHGGMSLSSAYPHIRRLRAEVRPKGNFLVQLTQFEQSIIKRTASLAARMANTTPNDALTTVALDTTPPTTISTVGVNSSTAVDTVSLTLKRKASVSLPAAQTAITTTPSPSVSSHMSNGVTTSADSSDSGSVIVTNGNGKQNNDDHKEGSADTSKRARIEASLLPSASAPPTPTSSSNTTPTGATPTTTTLSSSSSLSSMSVSTSSIVSGVGVGVSVGVSIKGTNSNIVAATAAPKRAKSVGPMLPPHLAHLSG